MQKVKRVKLDSGLEIYFLLDKKFTTSTIQMCFKTGWRNDQEKYRGLAHLFEHLVGKRTEKFPKKGEFAQKLDQSGIVCNAWTGPDTTVYWQNQTTENILKSLDLMLECIYSTKFDTVDLEKEKSVVLTEARLYKDNDSKMFFRYIMEALFPQTSLDQFFFGDESTLKNITLQTFEDFYKIYRNPKNSILFVGMPDSKYETKILKKLGDFYSKPKNKQRLTQEIILKYTDQSLPVKKKKHISKPEKNQAEIHLAFKYDKKLSSREKIAFHVLREIWVGGLNGKLLKKLRDEKGYVYSVDMWHSEYLGQKNYGCIATECDKQKKDEVLDIIKKFLIKATSNIDQKDIQRIIPIAVYKTKRPANPHLDVDELVANVIAEEEYIQSEQGLRILKTIKVKDLEKVIKKVFDFKNSSTLIME